MDAFSLVAQTSGLPDNLADSAEDLFRWAKRIEIQPLGPKAEDGWIMILDQKFSLWFYRQDGRLTYDGFEFGDYAREDERI